MHKSLPLSAPHRRLSPLDRRRDRGTSDGLVVMGDAVCTFNPIYGQGMSVAALQALALRTHLQRHARPQPVRFFRQIGRIVDVPWSMATGGDLAFPNVAGHRNMQMRVLNGYLAKLFAGAAHDPRLGRAFLRVAGLVDPPQALLAPGVAARVLRAARAGRRGHPQDSRRAATEVEPTPAPRPPFGAPSKAGP